MNISCIFQPMLIATILFMAIIEIQMFDRLLLVGLYRKKKRNFMSEDQFGGNFSDSRNFVWPMSRIKKRKEL